jgi:hypothetical protein
MAEAKSSGVESASAAPGEKRSVSRPRLARASESGDPVVHKLIGDLETARLNLAAARLEGVRDPDAEQSEATTRAALRRLGYE